LRTLVLGAEADRSLVGIVLVAISFAAMPFLSWLSAAPAASSSANAVSDSKQTLL
jgi:hypothetical protein